jgi:hypothetical protein
VLEVASLEQGIGVTCAAAFAVQPRRSRVAVPGKALSDGFFKTQITQAMDDGWVRAYRKSGPGTVGVGC